MAARSAKINIPAGVVTRVTDNAVSAIRLSNGGPYQVLAFGTNGTTEPTVTTAAGIPMNPGATIPASYLLSDLFPGVSGANHVWVYCHTATTVDVSHAAS